VGFGSIGRLTARKAARIGMRIVGYDPHIGPDDAAWARRAPTAASSIAAGRERRGVAAPAAHDATRGLLAASGWRR
jgi:lactate dehydrogenase-like 2-hydroxyacid dehydrogenase